jgi:hypothetical protein
VSVVVPAKFDSNGHFLQGRAEEASILIYVSVFATHLDGCWVPQK